MALLSDHDFETLCTACGDLMEQVTGGSGICEECAGWRCQTCTEHLDGIAPDPPICKRCHEDFDA